MISVRAQSAFDAKSRYPLHWAMCWKCDLIAPKCRNFTFPDWMHTSVEPCPPCYEPSDDFPPLETQTSAFFPSSVPEPEEHKAEARGAPARLNVAVKTGASGPKPEIPGAIGFPGVFCL